MICKERSEWKQGRSTSRFMPIQHWTSSSTTNRTAGERSSMPILKTSVSVVWRSVQGHSPGATGSGDDGGDSGRQRAFGLVANLQWPQQMVGAFGWASLFSSEAAHTWKMQHHPGGRTRLKLPTKIRQRNTRLCIIASRPRLQPQEIVSCITTAVHIYSSHFTAARSFARKHPKNGRNILNSTPRGSNTRLDPWPSTTTCLLAATR
jgi:hypothetical protein